MAASSLRRYALSLKTWLNFLQAVGVPWDGASPSTLAAFKEWRMSAEAAQSRVTANSFAADLAALNRFYSWVCLMHPGIENPIRVRHSRMVREDRQPRLEASPSGVRRADVKWLTPDAFRLWRDVGLRGFSAEQLPIDSWRGTHEDRNVAFAEGLFGTGLRCAEWASVLTIEIPDIPPGALVKCSLPDACAKGGAGRPYWIPRKVLQAVRFYMLEGSRPAAVSHAQQNGLYERIPDIVCVEGNGADRTVIVQQNGLRSRIALDTLSVEDRTRLFRRTDAGLEPLSLWLNGDGSPRRKEAWSKVFSDANRRVARQLTRDGLPPRLWARPHMLRHSFALRWYSIATYVSWQRSTGLTAAEQRDLRNQLGDVWFLLATLLGHRSAETTRLIYLEPFQAIQIERLVSLMDTDDQVSLTRLVDAVAANEPRVLAVGTT
ncbi:site-specific integrase [Mycobacteroides abscessus]|nr:site-specific integrase [Mycobacteroides abscessus]